MNRRTRWTGAACTLALVGSSLAAASTPAAADELSTDPPYRCGGELVDDHNGRWDLSHGAGRAYLYYNAETESNCVKLVNYRGTWGKVKLRKASAGDDSPWHVDVEPAGANAVAIVQQSAGLCVQLDATIAPATEGQQPGRLHTGPVACERIS